jgi:hypothetical protein
MDEREISRSKPRAGGSRSERYRSLRTGEGQSRPSAPSEATGRRNGREHQAAAPGPLGNPLTPIRTEMSGRVLVGSARPFPSKWLSLLQAPWRWFQLSGLRLLLSEGSSIPLRMAAILRSVAWARRGYMEPAPKGLRLSLIGQSQVQKEAYICYREKIRVSLRFLSIFDFHLVSQSWLDGWESCARTYKQQSQIEACPTADLRERTEDSKPSQAVQQSTKRDQLAPLP